MSDALLQSIPGYLALTDNISTSGQPDENAFHAIAEAGFEIVINLALNDSDNALEDEEGLVTSLGMQYIHIPVEFDRPASEDLDAFIQAVSANWKKRLFIHCAINMRVSAFMTLYRICCLGWYPEAALSEIRRIWEPDAVWQQFIEEQIAQRRDN
ncbi:protein tyrosine phosphatase family protein [Solemya velesiana gill symbiont]|uniref:DSP-PTPase phosphatase fused to NAD+ Kinase domain-containing protein n=1 Tax=Solemya velesiana gill symbiont TaxID=1918948 RepID=A0A1T2KTN9_9GAMM|nr:protein tyrosine phosphatase family protein [Solemya velesiana gill symbiont]OOZ36086.1 hypothetical protein BOW51_08815 [Solemya velesiana gill symbiont]